MTGFIIAMKNEAEVVLPFIDNPQKQTILNRQFYFGSIENQPCVVAVCGIGKVNAAICTQYIIDNFKPTRLINFGLAGGLGSDIEIGDIVFVNKSVQYDFDLSLINNCDIGKLEEFEDKFFKISQATSVFAAKILATGDRFNQDKQDEILISSVLKAQLRDMEGGAIAQTAIMNGVKLYMFKAVSDKVEKDSVKSYFENSAYALSNLKKHFLQIFKEILENEAN